MHSEGISYKPLCGEVEMCPQVGRMGPISEDGPGHYNLDWSEGPWGRAAEAARTEVLSVPRSPRLRTGKRRGTRGARRTDANRTPRRTRGRREGPV